MSKNDSPELLNNSNFEEFKPNYNFIDSREMTLKDFFNTIYVQFGQYRANQRIPRIDGLAETQRKVIWTALKKKYKKKVKLEIVMSDIRTVSNYHHGPASLANVLNNLIAPYKNGLAFLKPDGSFGSRSSRSAAAERYTETRVNNFLELMFPEEDIVATYGFRTMDGKPAEPLTLYPILPLGIINGQSQTSVGFRTELLQRDPKVILDLFIGILKGTITSIPSYIAPKWPLCDCEVTLDGPNSWVTKGKVRKVKHGRKPAIEIYEVPYNWDRNKLVDTLESYKESGLIENYIDATNNNVFSTIIIAPNLQDLPEDTIIDKLDLVSKVTELFTYINMDSRFVTECKNIASYINYFIQERIKVYEARKKYRLEKLAFDLNKTVALINYINEVNAGRIEFRNKSEEEVIEQLQKYDDSYNFKPMTKSFQYIDPNIAKLMKINTSYDYLFDFSVRNFTPAKVQQLNTKYQNLYQEYVQLQNLNAAVLWLQDLEEFEKIMLKDGWNK